MRTSPGILPCTMMHRCQMVANLSGLCLHKHHVKKLRMKFWGRMERCGDGFREVASTVWHPLLFCIPECEPRVVQ